MPYTKLDRANLRRTAQRVESYTSLLSQENILKISKIELKKLKCEAIYRKTEMSKISNKENEVQCMPYENELEVTSVMTRSATRKYAYVGAIHNRVDFEQELKVKKRWPTNVSYPIPNPPNNHLQLKNIISRSLNKVMSFCKYAVATENTELKKHKNEINLRNEYANCINLTPYLTQVPILISGNDESQITLHLNDISVPPQFINIISLNEQEQNETLVIQDKNEDYETITLHSGETYLFDNNTNSVYFNQIEGEDDSQNTYHDDRMMAVNNDHTYAMKLTEKMFVASPHTNFSKSVKKHEHSEFKLETALNDLLLNTAILKCLTCGETPQELAMFLQKAKFHY